MPYSGSCHCGALHYTCDTDPAQVMTCNCSICRRKGAVLHFVSPSQVHLTADPQALGIYRFNKHIIAHHFCKRLRHRHLGRRSPQPDGSRSIAINLRSADLDFAALPTHGFDGAAI